MITGYWIDLKYNGEPYIVERWAVEQEFENGFDCGNRWIPGYMLSRTKQEALKSLRDIKEELGWSDENQAFLVDLT